MRHPSQKHNVARLRAFLNQFEKFDQKQFADLIGCSVHKLQNIETGRTPLDELLARQISAETGVAVKWLLENNTKAPPVSAVTPVRRNKKGRITHASVKRAVREHGRAPFTAASYRRARLVRDLALPTESGDWFAGDTFATVFYAWMCAIFATEHGHHAVSKTEKFLEALTAEFGHSPYVISTPDLKVAMLDADHFWQHVKVGLRLAGALKKRFGNKLKSYFAQCEDTAAINLANYRR